MSNSDLAQALTREEAYGQLLQRLLGGEGAATEGAGAASEVCSLVLARLFLKKWALCIMVVGWCGCP